MSIDPKRTPVLVGIGQSIEREGVTNIVELAARAAEAAFNDAPGLREKVQRLSLVGISFSPVSLTPATEIVDKLRLGDITREVTTPGGNTPQWLMNRACDEIVAGDLETTLIVGAEATRSMKLADPDSDFLKAATQDRSAEAGPKDDVVGDSIRGMLSAAEIQAGLVRPADTYPIFESALAAKLGTDAAGSRARIAAFMSRSSEVAARNPIAWFPEVRTVAEIGEPTPANRITAEPYTKRMNSFATVDQGSALLVTTLAIAQEAGLADQCIYPWAGASNTDLVPVERKDLAGSPALRAAAAAAFAGAGVGVEDVDFFDIYSCFPIAVELGAAAIDLGLDDPRGLTQTGGMSFFGGPGNNYTSHGIAAVALKLREGGRLGYVSGNGGILSKHSIGIYSNEAPAKAFRRVDTTKEQEAIAASALEVALEAYGTATVDGGTVVYGRDGAPVSAPIIATLADGRRVVANASPETLPRLAGRTLVGETVSVSGTNPPLYSL